MNESKFEVLGNLVEAMHQLEECPEFARLVPEVRVNLVYALPGARKPDEVAAIEGRITSVAGRPYAPGLPAWGASDHMARLVIEVSRYDPTVRAGINFRYDEVIKKVVQAYCAEKGLSFGWIDRTKEPAKVMERDGSSMPWKMKYLIDTFGAIPRIFYEGEGWGKEPLFVTVGRDAVEVAGIAIDVARRYRQKVQNE